MSGAFRASAPGKILVAGEYAVLEGAEAVVVAISRRAVARDTGGETELSRFLEAAREELAGALGERSAAARAARRIEVDTRAFHTASGEKLGLGSSAAATVAAIACALGAGAQTTGTELAMDAATRSQIHNLAHAAHGEAQARLGARGSGADVAAAVHGGAVAIAAPEPGALPSVRSLPLPSDLHLVTVWTGASAATTSLVAAVGRFAALSRGAYRRLIDAIADASGRLSRALETGDAPAAVEAVAAGGRAIAALGDAASVPLEAPIHRDLARMAARHRGAAKPTGAGAGDVALAAFSAADRAEGFCSDLAARGIKALSLDVDANGVSFG